MIAHRMRWMLPASLVLALGGWEPFRAVDPDVEAGNRAYADGRYDDALAAYDRAARAGGVDPDGLALDRGTAELGKADAIKDPEEKRRLTERAVEDLTQAARAKDPRIRGAANYNRGNALMAQDTLDDAIEAYKQSLRDDPERDDARLNLELALRRRQNQRRQQGHRQGQNGQQGQGQGLGPQQSQGQGQQGLQQGQGQNQRQNGSRQGSGQNGSNGEGSDHNGSNQNGSNQNGSNQNGSNQDGSNQNRSNQDGSNQDGSNDQGSTQNGSNGRSSDQPHNGPGEASKQSGSNPAQNGSSDQPSSDQPSSDRPARRRPPPGRAAPRSPRTPAEGKLDDLDNYSRRLQKDQARRRATGRQSDPQHDW